MRAVGASAFRALGVRRWKLVPAIAIVLGGVASGPAPASAISSPPAHPWIVVLCKFTDLTTEPNPPSYYAQEYAKQGTSSNLTLVDYWRDISYGQLDISGTAVVTKWYSLGITRYEWAGYNRYDKIRTCAEEASGDVNYANYFGVLALFNDDRPGRSASTTLSTGIGTGDTTITVASSTGFPAAPFAVVINSEELHVTATSGNTWTVTRAYENGQPAAAHSAGATVTLIDGGDLGESGANAPVGVTLGGHPYTLGFVVGPPNFNLTGSAHETGHSFGYHHTRTIPLDPQGDYGDCFDDMSGYATCSFVGDFGGSNLGSVNAAAGPGMTAIGLQFQGWLPASRLFQLDNSACNQTTLGFAGLNYFSTPGYLAARIPASVSIATPGPGTTTSDFYWLEYRDKTGWDAGIPQSSVVLHLHGLDDYGYWLKTVGHGGALLTGDEFVDAGQKTYIAVNAIDTTAHQARVTVAGCKIDSALTYSGDTNGEYNDSATLAGDLRVSGSGAPVPFQPVTFTLGTQSCAATTDASGHASCPVTITQTPGSVTTVSASFPGDNAYNPASAASAFTINREESSLAYTGDTTSDYHDPATMTAVLIDPDGGAPIASEPISFQLGTSSTDVCSALTGAGGMATCSITPTQASGPVALTASFAGDAKFLPSTATATFVIKREETATTYTGPTVIGNGVTTTLSGVLKEDGTIPIAGRTLTMTLGSGSTQQTCVTGPTDAAGSASCTLVPSQPLGAGSVSAAFLGDPFYLPSSDTKATILFGFLDRGAFVIGDGNLQLAAPHTYWGARWAKLNTLSGGDAPNAFKGFASETAEPPMCGVGWSAEAGNSGRPPTTVPAYMGVIVSSAVAKSGSEMGGSTVEIVVIKTDPGYGGDPGHEGTGTVVASPSDPTQPAVFCHS